MKTALAVILPTLAIAYLAAWRVAEPWHDRRAMHPAARAMLWVALAFSACGFGAVLLWFEILAVHLGHIPAWGARAYAPAIETVAVLDALALAATGVVQAIVSHRREPPPRHDHGDVGEGLADIPEMAIDLIGSGSGGGRGAAHGAAALADAAGSAGAGSWEWPSLGIGLDLGEDGAIIAVGVGVFLLAAFLVAISLCGGGFVAYWVLRWHAPPEPGRP